MFDTVRETVYVPITLYVCDGFCAVLVVPSPKSQSHEAGLFVERSEKFTVSVSMPVVAEPLKSAMGSKELNVADILISPFAITVQAPVPLHPPPDQPANTEFASGAAVKVTAVP
jgi:hypothetical protein